FEMTLQILVVVNLKVVRRVDVPVELVVVDQILSVVRDERDLRGRGARVPGDKGGGQQRDGVRAGRTQSMRGYARAHRRFLGIRGPEHRRRLTSSGAAYGLKIS